VRTIRSMSCHLGSSERADSDSLSGIFSSFSSDCKVAKPIVLLRTTLTTVEDSYDCDDDRNSTRTLETLTICHNRSSPLRMAYEPGDRLAPEAIWITVLMVVDAETFQGYERPDQGLNSPRVNVRWRLPAFAAQSSGRRLTSCWAQVSTGASRFKPESLSWAAYS
jgi:hypothetical protein